MTPFYTEGNFSVSEVLISRMLVTMRDDGFYTVIFMPSQE